MRSKISARRRMAVQGADAISRREWKNGPSGRPSPARHAIPPRHSTSKVPSRQEFAPAARILPVAKAAPVAEERWLIAATGSGGVLTAARSEGLHWNW